jgi:hypothetical protein
MAQDDQDRFERYGRPAARAASANDPLAELARLIGQSDPFGEFGRTQQAAPQTQPRPQSDWGTPGQGSGYAAPPTAPEAAHYGAPGYPPHQATHGNERPFGQHDYQPLPGEQGYDPNYYYDNEQPHGEEHYDDVPPRRRLAVIAIAAVVALAVLGTAGAFGYRALFGTSGSAPPRLITADTTPSKVVPPNKSEPQSNKQIYDRVGERSAGERLVSREEQPIERPQAPVTMPASPASSPALQSASIPGSGMANAAEPKRVRTIAIKPDQAAGASDSAPAPTPRAATAKPAAQPARVASAPPLPLAEDAAPARPSAARPASSRNGPMSLSPESPAPAPAPRAETRTASVAPTRVAPEPAGSGQYAVQVSSQRSEADAQAAYRSLQAKFPQLAGKPSVIRRADLGDKGVYYRAMVGPFGTGSEASELCQSLKSAGGQCIIQKN